MKEPDNLDQIILPNARRVAVVGGGAAGMMAAATLAEEAPGVAVTLFERNRRLGAKVLISGGGRCNVTTGLTDVPEVLHRYPRGARWLRHALYSFPPAAVVAWFEAHGVPLKTEADLRVFPVSDNGRDVVAAFERVFAGEQPAARPGSSPSSAVALPASAGRVVESHSGSSRPGGAPLPAPAGGRVAVRLRSAVRAVRRAGEGFLLDIAGEQAPAGPFDRLIITTGGSAFAHTGSAGDGFAFARALGHTVTPLAPSLGAYVLAEPWVRDLAGVSLGDVVLEIPRPTGAPRSPPREQGDTGDSSVDSRSPLRRRGDAGGPLKTERAPAEGRPDDGSARRRRAAAPLWQRGALLFTHVGITGPAVFALSSLAAFEPFDAAQPLPIRLSLLPDISAEQADALLRERFAAMPGRGLANLLDTLLPRSLCPLLCALAGADPALPVARVPRPVRLRLASLLTALPLTATGRRAGEEFVTAGGVALDEIDPRTMQSRLVPGLFFAGEVLDVDGFTGGFNLQSAWATGRLAGLTAGSEER